MLTWYKTKMYETKRKSSIKTVRYYEYHQHTQTHMCDDCVCSWYIHLKMYASLNGGNNKWEWILVKISFCMRVVFYLQKLWFYVKIFRLLLNEPFYEFFNTIEAYALFNTPTYGIPLLIMTLLIKFWSNVTNVCVHNML